MDWYLGITAIALLATGLVGQAFEMRAIRRSAYGDEELASPNIFMDRRNFKWYAMIGVGVMMWYVAERGLY